MNLNISVPSFTVGSALLTYSRVRRSRWKGEVKEDWKGRPELKVLNFVYKIK